MSQRERYCGGVGADCADCVGLMTVQGARCEVREIVEALRTKKTTEGTKNGEENERIKGGRTLQQQ